MYLCRYQLASTPLGKWEGVDESNKKWHRMKDVQPKKWCLSHNFFIISTFFYDSIFPSWFFMKLWQYYREQQKEPIQERAYQCIWNNHLDLHKNIIIPLLYQCGLFIHTCVSENSILYKDVIIYLSFFSFYSYLFLVNNIGEVIEQKEQNLTKVNEVKNAIKMQVT